METDVAILQIAQPGLHTLAITRALTTVIVHNQSWSTGILCGVGIGGVFP
jgi:uncharacterized membrane protein YesL